MTKIRVAPRSLRWRLQLWQGFLLIAMMTGFGITIYQLQKLNRFRQVDEELETRVTALNKTVRDAHPDRPPTVGPPDRDGRGPLDRKAEEPGPPPPNPPPRKGPRGRGGPGDPRMGPPLDNRPSPPMPPPRPLALSPETADLFGSATGYYFTIWDRDGIILNRSANAPQNSPCPAIAERDTLLHFRTRGEFREAVHCTGFGDCSMAGRSINADLGASRTFAWMLFGAGAAVLAVGFGLGAWLIGRAIRPLEEIRETASRIDRGSLSERIRIARPDDELGQLASVLNSTFARLESAFLRQQQFTSDAAHELRTPLAIMISEAQTTLARERTAAEYREAVEGGLETAQQMRRITEMLLELARFDAADPALARERINLAAAAAPSIERLKTLTAPRGVIIESDLSPATTFMVRERLEVVIANLLANAIYYNKPGGEVRVVTRTENSTAVLEVSDTGIGILPEDLPHIFDRFYRADKVRSRADGHAGLGLSICKTIVEAEGGCIEVSSTPHERTTFIVRFPAGLPDPR